MAVSFGAINPSAINTTTDVIVGSSFNVVWWSDGQAIKDKIALAKKLGVRGIAVFKIDGGEDQALWDFLPKLR
jgi:spore germination protein YaaH